MARSSSGPHSGPSYQGRSTPSGLLYAAALVATAGVVVALVIAWTHAKIAAGGPGYTSFCNVSDAVNCDRVLTSPFAKLFGIPVAWFAVAAYAALAVLFASAARARGRMGGASLLLALAGTVWAAVFSAYMAYVSFFVLETVCLLCSALYAITAALVGLGLLALLRLAPAGTARPQPLPGLGKAVAGMLILSVIGVAALAAVTWPSRSRLLAGDPPTLAELREADPDFYDWYTSLPVVRTPLDEAGAVIGAPSAPVTIVEFSDFECGFCARNHRILKDLLERFPDTVRVVYRHFPLDAACNEALEASLHPRACRAAEAAECAALQGRFEAMADAMFEEQRRLYGENLERLAEGIGLDMDAFRRCMRERKTLSRVLEDSGLGNRLGITSTPTLFINGRRVVGTLENFDRYVFVVMLEARLSQARGATSRWFDRDVATRRQNRASPA